MRGTGEADSIVWMVDGQERSFETAPERPLLWLEESSTWGQELAGDERPPREEHEGEDESGLIWLS